MGTRWKVWTDYELAAAKRRRQAQAHVLTGMAAYRQKLWDLAVLYYKTHAYADYSAVIRRLRDIGALAGGSAGGGGACSGIIKNR